ncbi:MAG: NnrS family protein [Paracoccus sp. (in: a-proteobacteria)]|uniref:NnrS family protein n=1 Tax=Paracoccus sp. TaxID=267 RepID=UPI0026DF79B2|nr:NnrS family protein [Paracoccus sp. (in: a-proteobacteria)]MDO5612221.1 NnrS family protein [Paracoccus sp. (in: a-proteobacteria)]
MTSFALLATPWRAFLPVMAILSAAVPLAVLHGWQAPAGHGGLMLLVMVLGAICGYAPSALPGWDGGPVPSPAVTAALLVLWLLTLAGAAAGVLWLIWALPVGLSLLLLRRRRGSAKRWVVSGAAMTISALIVAGQPADAVLIAAALVAGIGARAVPAFLAGITGQRAADMPRIWPISTALLVAAAIPCPPAALAAAGCVLAQMRAWSLSAVQRPAGAMLVAAWIGLAAGLAAHGFGLTTAALHLLTMGAIAPMIAAISTRAGMRRSGRAPVASPAAMTSVTLLMASACLRLAAAAGQVPLGAAYAVWCAGWAAYLTALAPALHGPPLRPAFSGRRSGRSAD